jgi:hypothetical protein
LVQQNRRPSDLSHGYRSNVDWAGHVNQPLRRAGHAAAVFGLQETGGRLLLLLLLLQLLLPLRCHAYFGCCYRLLILPPLAIE